MHDTGMPGTDLIRVSPAEQLADDDARIRFLPVLYGRYHRAVTYEFRDEDHADDFAELDQ
jgi:hypothetical protein